MCGGITGRAETREVWRLGLERLRWGRLPDLTVARRDHACCVVRGGTLVALGGRGDHITPGGGPDSITASVEVQDTRAAGDAALSRELPRLSCGPFSEGSALAVDESESESGQVLLLGGLFETPGGPRRFMVTNKVWSVDLATGLCTPQPPLRWERYGFAAARLPGGRVVCAGGDHLGWAASGRSVEMWEPTRGAWRDLPEMSTGHFDAAGCFLSDGRFAILGGSSDDNPDKEPVSSCEALALDGTERWEPMPPMRQARRGFAAAAVGGCVLVAGGTQGLRSVEVYEEAAGVWRRPKCDLPRALCWMGSALL